NADQQTTYPPNHLRPSAAIRGKKINLQSPISSLQSLISNQLHKPLRQVHHILIGGEAEADTGRAADLVDPGVGNGADTVASAGEGADDSADGVGIAAKVAAPEHALAEVAICEAENGVNLRDCLGTGGVDRRPQLGV